MLLPHYEGSTPNSINRISTFNIIFLILQACPCPCAVGSRELTIAELSADSLEDLHIVARQQIEDHKLKAFDCNGATKSTLKKLFKGLITPNGDKSNAGDKSKNSAENNVALDSTKKDPSATVVSNNDNEKSTKT